MGLLQGVWPAARAGLTRLGALLATIIVASFVIFVALNAVPGNKVATITHGRTVSPQVEKKLEERLHLDEPVLQRYVTWLTDAAHGDLGYSTSAQATVSSIIGPRAVVSAQLVLLALVVAAIVGVALGVWAGASKGWADSFVLLVSSVGLGIPSFLLALLLISVFAINLEWLPAVGSGSGGFDRFEHLILPAIALAGISAAYLTRVTRTAVREELGSEHVETALGRGIPRRSVLRRHVVRNAAVPIITSGALVFAGMLAGMVLVEQAFSLDGLGSYLVLAVQRNDPSVVEAITLLLVVTFVLLSFVLDVLYVRLDPRMRVRPGKS